MHVIACLALCPHGAGDKRKRQPMKEEQAKCIEAIKALCEAAIDSTKTYEDVIEQIGTLMDTCPEP
jgi:hypothetical protein